MGEWVKCENCSTQITKESAEKNNNLCIVCKSKKLIKEWQEKKGNKK